MLYAAAEECGYAKPIEVDELLGVPSQKRPLKKTAEPSSRNLSRQQIVRLAVVFPTDKMAEIAKRYLDIDGETIRNMETEHNDDPDAYKRGLIKRWINQNPEDQIQVNIIGWLIKI